MAELQKVQLKLSTGEVIVGMFTEMRSRFVPKLKDYPFTYDCRHDDADWTNISSIEPYVLVNHSGTFLSAKRVPMMLDKSGFRYAPVDSYDFIH